MSSWASITIGFGLVTCFKSGINNKLKKEKKILKIFNLRMKLRTYNTSHAVLYKAYHEWSLIYFIVHSY